MASPQITVTINQGHLDRRLGRLAEAASPQQVLPVIGRKMTTLIQLGFRGSVSPWGQPWQPLNPRATRRGQPLRDTGQLLRSIGWQISGDKVAIGTNVQHARVHQFGATITPVNAKLLRWIGAGGTPIFAKRVVIPARPFMPMTASGVSFPAPWRQQTLEAIRQAILRRGGT